MISNKKTISKMISLIIIIYGVIVFGFSIKIFDAIETIYLEEYIFLLMSMMVLIIWYIYIIYKINDKIFNPLSVVTLLWILTYHISPMVNILTEETDLVGVNVMSGCYKATILALGSYFTFTFGYAFTSKKTCYKKEIRPMKLVESNSIRRKKVIICSFLFIGIISAFLGMIVNGYSLSYIISLGLFGDRDEYTRSTAIGFITNFQYCLVPCILFIKYDFKWMKLEKIAFLITSILYLINGFRVYLVVLILSYFLFPYIAKIKKLKFKTIILLLTIILIMIGGVELYRSSMRAGSGILGADWNQFSLLYIWNAINGNFNLYKTTYAVVEYIPKYMNYTLGQEVIATTALTLIPRAIWPNKITSTLTSSAYLFIGIDAYNQAWALSTVCEFYAEFTAVGCLIVFFLYGKVFKWSTKLYLNINTDIENQIAYTIWFSFFWHFIIRGYMPTNFWVLLFFLLPVIVCKFSERYLMRQNKTII